MTPLIDAARTLLALLDEHHLPPWRTLAERRLWVAAVEDLRTLLADAEADLPTHERDYLPGESALLERQRNEARTVARQLWREGGYETSTLLPNDYPWLLKEQS